MNLSDYARILGKKGGNANKIKHDHAHFQNLGRIGMQKRWGNFKKTEYGVVRQVPEIPNPTSS